MRKTLANISIVVAVVLCLQACGKPATPDQITEKFWTAVTTGEAKQVKKYVSAKDKATLRSLDDILPIETVTFGKIIIDGRVASVDTNVRLAGGRATDLPINTHLVQENEQWVVDYERTMQTMLAAGQVAAVINQFRDIGVAIKKGIGQSVNEFQKALPEIEQGLSNMEQQIEQAMPKLKSRFEKFSRELEQALNTPPADVAELGPDEEKDGPSSSTPDSGQTENPRPRLSEELAQIEQEILNAVPELKEQIHDFVEQLQEALKKPPIAENGPNSSQIEPGKPIEI
ncbi:MAG: hypothetical protein ACU84Q_07940 [Gammaproteobacteria bacterium]